jgi:hypothetical protein
LFPKYTWKIVAERSIAAYQGALAHWRRIIGQGPLG